MSSRPLLQPQQVITNGNMSGNITSMVTIISNLSMMSYSYSWSGTSPSGTVSVEVSNDYSQNGDGTVKNSGTWTALVLSNSPAVSGNTGNGQIEIEQLGAYAIRTKYTFISGVGTLQAFYKAKVS